MKSNNEIKIKLNNYMKSHDITLKLIKLHEKHFSCGNFSLDCCKHLSIILQIEILISLHVFMKSSNKIKIKLHDYMKSHEITWKFVKLHG